MTETITTTEAIKKGHLVITYPVIAANIICVSLSIYLKANHVFESKFYILAGVIPAFIISWLYWSIAIPKWKIWAFEKVDDVHELKSGAIQEKLIWPDNSIFRKTEIWSSQDKEKWEVISKRFN